MAIARKHVMQVIEVLLTVGARTATKYVSPRSIIRATRPWYRGTRKYDGRDNIAIRLTMGRPNYLEREFIKRARRAGEPFPVKKIQYRMPPRTKRA